MKKAAVTGGGGFIGSHLAKRLSAMGVETVTLGRRPQPGLTALGIRHFCGDIRDPAFLRDAFLGCDTVFHVAALAGIWGKKEDFFSINVSGTVNVVDICLYHRVPRLIYTSTPSVVFSGEGIEGGNEALPHARHFLCHYAASKAWAERLALAANCSKLKVAALRPHLVWGPHDTNLIPRLLERGRRGLLRQVGDGTNLVDISYIDNVVDAHLAAAANLEGSGTAAGRAYFISQGQPESLWGWIGELFQRAGVPPVKKRVSFRQAYAAGFLLELLHRAIRSDREPRMTRFLAGQLAKPHWFSIARARAELGYDPAVSSEEGMRRLVAWVKLLPVQSAEN